jgi:2-dehydropantoate 2-reductase
MTVNMMDRSIGIVGSGKVAGHFEKYFTYLGLDVVTWSRKNDAGISPEEKLASCRLVFILVSDGAIEELVFSLKEISGRLVHCSGSLVIHGVPSYHPLMTFTHRPMTPETYKSIPFIQEENAPPLKELIPELPNDVYTISAASKGLYHALSVLSGNFSAFLWKHAMDLFEEKLQLPREVLFSYLRGVTENLEETGGTSLSGPLVRKDRLTVEKNLAALEGDRYRDIYQAFVNAEMGNEE